MAENKMKEVAKLLGVEMGVPFNVITNVRKEHINNPFKITERGLTNCLGYLSDTVLINLLSGIYEIKKPILDNVEKRYLEGVLRPFKESVLHIEKNQNKYGQWIFIDLKEDYLCLPYFEDETMYKGMELDKAYTLEELGLFNGGSANNYR